MIKQSDKKVNTPAVMRFLSYCSRSFTVLSIGIVIIINLANNRVANAAANGDYRTVASGNWSDITVWQKYNGTIWIAAVTTPTYNDKVITIETGYAVTITASVTIDQVIINAGGTVSIDSGVTVTIYNGTSTDMSVSGVLQNSGTITINSSANITIQGTGVYRHNFSTTAGTIPTATWISGSTCEIVGYTSNTSSPSGLQTFSNFTWNCPLQSGNISLGGGLTTVNGNLTITSTGTGELHAATGALTLNVATDYIQTGGTFVLTKSNTAATINITGNYNQSGGTFKPIDGNNTATVNLSSDMTHTGGTITQGGSGTGNFIFKKAGTQLFTASNHTVTGTINFTVNNGTKLDMNTSIMYGNNFTLSPGGELIIGSPSGITSGVTQSGNIQVTGTRTFNITSDYTFDASSAQVTGNGLPATVRNLKIDNTNHVTLTNTVAVTGTMTFVNGHLNTSTNEVSITNTSTAAIAGYSSSNYIFGNLRRSVSSSGTYNFPVGTGQYYELMTLTLASTAGFSNILAQFTNANPLNPSLPLNNMMAEGISIENMLNYGYWTITPNATLSSGTYTATLTETGHSAISTSSTATLFRRSSSAVSWTAVGTHTPSTQILTASSVTAARSLLNVFGEFAIAYGEMIRFNTDSLLAGTAGQIGAIYRFPNVVFNVDAWVEILDLAGGAVLTNIDDTTVGYGEGWQPFIQTPANSTASIYWKISLKIHDTTTDTTLKSVYLTALDIDGATNLKEFVEAFMPYSYALGGSSTLTITNNAGYYRATSNNTTVSNIDTSQNQVMFQVRYSNINTFYWRTGIINNTASAVVRQTALYFKSFVSGNIALPISLKYFNASLNSNAVDLKWSTASEVNNSYFTIERSADGIDFEPLLTEKGAGNSSSTINYFAKDDNPLTGYSYYRLRQTDFDGKFTISEPEAVFNPGNLYARTLDFSTIGPNPFDENLTVTFNSSTKNPVNIFMTNAEGRIIAAAEINTFVGNNVYDFSSITNLTNGIYFVSLQSGDQKITKKVLRK